MEFGKFQSFYSRKHNSPTTGVKILLADPDQVSRHVVATMLQCLGYEVVIAARAIDVLYIVEENKDVLSLAIVDSRWNDIEIYDLIEKMRESCTNLPCFIMSAAPVADELPISIAMYKGAMLFFKKPLSFIQLSGLWRFARKNKIDKMTVLNANGQGFERYMGVESQPFMNMRGTWTNNFSEMCYESAAINAFPMRLQHVMDVPGHTEQNISNYVQEISSGQNSTSVQDEIGMPGKLQSATHTSYCFGEFMNEGYGEASTESSQVENATDEKALSEDKLDSSVDSTDGEIEMQFSTFSANDIDNSQQIFPELLIPPLPLDEKEHEFFGVEVGKSDETFYGSKEIEQFSDEDLDTWLSSFISSELLDKGIESIWIDIGRGSKPELGMDLRGTKTYMIEHETHKV
ncbi:Signal transduction response regulator, receiver domain [Sesbania bispinosa]|nr:Signal transduction response regulator, receiver domain [Sesbania bispinosa]